MYNHFQQLFCKHDYQLEPNQIFKQCTLCGHRQYLYHDLTYIDSTFHIEFVYIKSGTWICGDLQKEIHTRSFWMSKYPISVQQYFHVVDNHNDSYSSTEVYPITGLSYRNICRWLKNLNCLSKSIYQYYLPTETEWEYAARAHTVSEDDNIQSVRNLELFAWGKENSNDKIQPCGLLLPNDFGLYDMYGNIYEICNDISACYADINTMTPSVVWHGKMSLPHMIRGGSYFTMLPAQHLSRVGISDVGENSSTGFRIVTAHTHKKHFNFNKKQK